MFRKNLLVFSCFVLCLLIFPLVVNADFSHAYRASKDGKSVVNINGKNVYFSAALEVNATSNDEESHLVPFDNVVATYQKDTIYINIKRSEINKILRNNKFDNITTFIDIYGDYLDMDKSKNYYFFWENYDTKKYFYETYAANYMMRTYNVFEVFNSCVSLVGYDYEENASLQIGRILFENDSLPSNYSVGEQYDYNKIDFSVKPIIDSTNIKMKISIIEDETIDLGSNTNIVTRKGNIDENGNHTGSTIENININNFYADYFDNNKLNYSWTMYDKDGNPAELNVDTDIAIDDSSNEENILSLLPKNLSDMKDRIKFISFAHEGDLNGTAKISIYVGDKFKPGETLRLYYFNPVSEELEQQPLTADASDGFYDIVVDKDGYVTLTFTHCSEYILTDLEVANIIDNTDQKLQKIINQNTADYKLIVGTIALAILIVVAGIVILIKRKKK